MEAKERAELRAKVAKLHQATLKLPLLVRTQGGEFFAVLLETIELIEKRLNTGEPA
jgi:hypothetical protein